MVMQCIGYRHGDRFSGQEEVNLESVEGQAELKPLNNGDTCTVNDPSEDVEKV